MDISVNKGRYSSEQETLEETVKELVDYLQPVELWLFGSRARGDYFPDSDFDFLVVIKVSDPRGVDDFARVRRPLRNLGVGCDVIPIQEDEMAREIASLTSVAQTALEEGHKVYDTFAGYQFPSLDEIKASYLARS